MLFTLPIASLFNWAELLFPDEPETFDILSELPPEIATMILRQLDIDSLYKVLLVSTRWRELCTSDPILMRRIRLHIRKRNRISKENRPSDEFADQAIHSVKLENLKRKRVESLGNLEKPEVKKIKMMRM